MERVFASLERVRALWLELEKAKPKTPEYEALTEQIRAEAKAYLALIESEKTPRKDPSDR